MKKFKFYLLLSVVVFSLHIVFADLNNIENLGKLIYEDENLSMYQNQSCRTCHHPGSGFADFENFRDPYNSVVSTGSDNLSVGGRNAPSAAYAGFSPIFKWDSLTQQYVGGLFWDGRATGARLMDPLAEQAQGPFLNPVEMAMPNAASVVAMVAASSYANLFVSVFPGTDFNNVSETYDNIAKAIAAYERSSEVNSFNSKFDAFWTQCKKDGIKVSEINMSTNLNSLPQGILTRRQLKGLALFNDPSKGNCAACHSTKDFVDKNGVVHPPLFTDFTYDNLGIPKSTNPSIANNAIDYGLGGRQDINDVNQYGKFKVPTLRNINKTAPYGHNGYFANLNQIVNFYNTRDKGQWPEPEVALNVNNTELGNLGLNRNEEFSLIVFMRALTDRP